MRLIDATLSQLMIAMVVSVLDRAPLIGIGADAYR